MPTIPGIIYRLEFINTEAVTVRIDITPLDIQIPDTDLPTVIPLVGGAAPLVISSINNDQDKFQPIRSKQAVIQIVSGNGIDITTFSEGSDNNWKVDITETTFANTVIFTGYLILADNQMPFQPIPQYVVLTATDHLAAIKEIPWVDYADANPSGKYRVADIITQCLRRTGLSLPLNVVNNLRIGSGEYTVQAFFSQADQHILIPTGTPNAFFYPGQVIAVTGTVSNNGTFHVESATFSGANTTVLIRETITITELALATVFTDQVSSNHWYDITLIEALSYEDQVDTKINCYDVLSRIFGEDCYITQWKGEWWIYRVDEMEGNPVYVAHFDTAGVWTGTDAGIQIDKSIGAADLIKFANADTLLRFIRPHGSIEERFDYETPLEVPCNVDFSRGNLRSTVSADEKTFNPECWTKLRYDNPLTPSTEIYVRKTYINGTEDSRYVVFETSGSANNALMSEPIPVNRNDRFDMNFQRKLSSDIGGSGFYRNAMAQLRLYGKDGTYWTFEGPTSTGTIGNWGLSNSTFTANQVYINVEGNLSDDLTQLASNYGDSVITNIPVGGYIRILLIQGAQGNSRDILMPPPTIRYIPYINGTYEKFSGQENEIVRTATGYMPRRDTQVYISDSPAPLFKGTMFFLSGYSEIYNASAQFIAASSTIQMAGFHLDRFYVGLNIQVTGTASNNITAKITAASYDIGGDFTTLTVDQVLVNETVASVISEALYSIVQNWFSAQQIGNLINTDPARLHPYGYIQAYSVWNQFRGADDPNNARGMGINIFSGSLKGLSAFTNWPDLLYRVTLVDANPQTNDRYFILISLSIDWKSAMWNGVFIEVQNFLVGKNYDDPITFKYITE